jgi:regulation of enolase protein 1 (concanavalin A-like superfamily)
MPIVIPRLIVEIFQHTNFRGRSGFVIEPVPQTRELGFQDNISSLVVYKGPGYASNPSYKVILHQHAHFKGRQLALGPGYYPNLHDMIYNFGDIVSSISFGSPMLQSVGPEWGTIPLIVECYQHVEYKGRKVTVLRDIAHTGELGIHDQISSIRIFKGPDFPREGAEVSFYQHVDFEGARLPIRMRPEDYKKEVPNLHLLPQNFGDMISSIKIEGWASSGEFTTMVFEDEFIGNQMNPIWQWMDPKGGGVWEERQGYLEMRVEPGQDLWHGNPPGQGGNMDAPRLLMDVSGDFAIETRIRVSPQLREHGGLIVWKNAHRFLRLEKTSGPHGFRGDVRFERHVNRRFQLVGRGSGLRNVRELFLRLERRGNLFSGYASSDGINWKGCGQTHVGMGDPVQVGLHALCPGNIPATLTRFDFFRLFKRKNEAAAFIPIVKTTGAPRDGVQPLADAQAEQQDEDARRRAARDVS